MAGEGVTLPQGPKGLVSVDWFAKAAVAKGDVVRIADGCIAFALADAKANEVVPMCIEADLAEAPKAQGALMPGQLLKWESTSEELSAAGNKDVNASIKDKALVGYVHDRAGRAAPRVRLVWRNFV